MPLPTIARVQGELGAVFVEEIIDWLDALKVELLAGNTSGLAQLASPSQAATSNAGIWVPNEAWDEKPTRP